MTSSPIHAARWFTGILASIVFMLCALGLTPQNVVDALPVAQQIALAESSAAPFIELAVAAIAVPAPYVMTMALAVGLAQARWGRTEQSAPLFPSTTATAVLAASLAVFVGALHPVLVVTLLLLWTAATAGIITLSTPGQRYGRALADETSGLLRVAFRLPVELATVLFSEAPSTEAFLRGIHREFATPGPATPAPLRDKRDAFVPGAQES